MASHSFPFLLLSTGKLDAFLNLSLNPNELALSRIIPPPMPRRSRCKAILRLERMQQEVAG